MRIGADFVIIVSYGVNEDGVIDYAALEKQVKTVRPKLIVAGASAYPRAIDFEKLAEIAHGYGAYLMVDMAHISARVLALTKAFPLYE